MLAAATPKRFCAHQQSAFWLPLVIGVESLVGRKVRRSASMPKPGTRGLRRVHIARLQAPRATCSSFRALLSRPGFPKLNPSLKMPLLLLLGRDGSRAAECARKISVQLNCCSCVCFWLFWSHNSGVYSERFALLFVCAVVERCIHTHL